MINIRKIIGRKYYPLNKITISQNQLLKNYSLLSNLSKKIQIAPVVKSNAYGHGVKEIVPILDKLNPPFICVDSLYEAYDLKNMHLKTPILIMGYVSQENLKIKPLNFSWTIYDIKQAKVLNEYQKGAKIHIKVDTGMHRLGIPISELDTLVENLKKLKNIQIEGLMSHFSSPKTSKEYTNYQIENFKTALKILEKNNITPKWKHVGASGGLINNYRAISTFTNLARVGISLYGLYRTNKLSKIKPILKMTTQIVQLKKIKRGEYVGYDKAYQAKRDMTIAVLPLGYNDGLDRRLTNIGFVKIKNSYAPVVGKVSMNLTTINVSGLQTSIGDQVIVFSNKPEDENSLEKAAVICNTIPHDLLVHLHPKAVKREIV